MDEKLYDKCIRCNRKLKTLKAKQRGYGDYCYHLHLLELKKHKRNLFSMISKQK